MRQRETHLQFERSSRSIIYPKLFEKPPNSRLHNHICLAIHDLTVYVTILIDEVLGRPFDLEFLFKTEDDEGLTRDPVFTEDLFRQFLGSEHLDRQTGDSSGVDGIRGGNEWSIGLIKMGVSHGEIAGRG